MATLKKLENGSNIVEFADDYELEVIQRALEQYVESLQKREDISPGDTPFDPEYVQDIYNELF